MDIIFNELSADNIKDTHEAQQLMHELFLAVKATKNCLQTDLRIRFEKHISEICLVFCEAEPQNHYTVGSWVFDQTVSKTLQDIFLSMCTLPYIPEENEEAEADYLAHTFQYVTAASVKKDCYGLCAAHILNTCTISLASNAEWKMNKIQILKIDDQREEKYHHVYNIFSEMCCTISDVKNFIEQNIPVVLTISNTPASKKSVHISEHHGYDELKKFAQRICRSPYVESIINSIPMNSQSRKFTHAVSDNGTIDIRLHWTNEGFGCAVKTTGKNKRETQAIAEILEREFAP